MWNKSRLTEILGIRYPIIQGPLGAGYSTIELVSTVSNAGALGSFGAVELTPQEIIDTNNSIRAVTDKPYAINLWVSDQDSRLSSYSEAEYQKVKTIFKPYFDEFRIPVPDMPEITGSRYPDQVAAVLEARPPVFSFIFGIPSPGILKECRKRNIVTIGTATTPDEAIALEQAEVDIVVASGFEAGGHRGSFLGVADRSLTGTFSLIPQVADKLTIPVVAAGGIVDGRGIAAAMILGAKGVQMGTAFLACSQSKTTDLHREKLFSKEAQYTVLTKVFSGRLARTIKNQLTEDLQDYEKEFAPYPLQRLFVRSLFPKLMESRRPEYMAFMAGQSAPLLRYRDAKELLNALISDTEKILSQVSLFS